MAGGALAANHYIITSTSQIKPSVRRALQGNRGPAGPQGPQGPQGTAGRQGAAANLAYVELRLRELCSGIHEAWERSLASPESTAAWKEINEVISDIRFGGC